MTLWRLRCDVTAALILKLGYSGILNANKITSYCTRPSLNSRSIIPEWVCYIIYHTLEFSLSRGSVLSIQDHGNVYFFFQYGNGSAYGYFSPYVALRVATRMVTHPPRTRGKPSTVDWRPATVSKLPAQRLATLNADITAATPGPLLHLLTK